MSSEWVEKYLKDMRELDHIPDVWVKAAVYQVKNAFPGLVEKVKVLEWLPTQVDTTYRMVEGARFLCKAHVDGEEIRILLALEGEPKLEVLGVSVSPDDFSAI